MTRFILASASPRRRALLEALGIEIEVVPSVADETFEGSPREMVALNARRKRDEVAARIQPPGIVIAADTLVFLEEQPLGKPADLDEARAMLRRLSGVTHEVMTGVAVVDTESGVSAEGVEVTRVTFCALQDAQIGTFVDAVHPLDRAGAYTVDGPGSLLVARYEGCYQNVLGLPMVCLDGLLQRLNCDLFRYIDKNRATFL
jgi:septum formation protein